MSLCVPEWDGSGGAVAASNDAFHGNGKVEFVSSRKIHYSEVPDQDAVEAGWNEYEQIDMQGQNGKCTKAQWQYYSSGWSNNGDDGVTPSKPKSEAAQPVAADNADDEMVSYLQYPLDATLERNYCSDFFGELPPSSPHLTKESFGHKPVARSSYSVSDNRAAVADAAMMMGAGRAAGLLPQTGAEAFSKVRTLQPPQTRCNLAPKPSPMLPPKMQPVAPPQPTRPGNMNFSHFSRPAAFMKANLHSLAAAPAAPRSKLPTAEASTSTGSCIADSRQGNGLENSRWQDASPKDGDRAEYKSVTPAVDQEMCRQSGVTGEASEKGVSHVTQQPDVQEPTITSSSGGGYGTKEAATSTKRKSSEREDAECQSEDGEGESVDTKKPVTRRGSTAKRSRAAEVHNQSERRRRDRINEKMKALQELIPNSNKTDKASMLDEAIEYLKLLQLQLQMMSMRTGMTLPPMVVPPGLQQHMQVPQMGAMPAMGMGMMPMGLGMGMMDMGPGRAGMPMPSYAGPSMSSPSTVVDMHDLRYQTVAGGVPMDSYNAYLARQHQPVQMNQPLGLDKYNAYVLQQHQQQLLPQQQQQQHQLHQIHRQAPHMNGGPPH